MRFEAAFLSSCAFRDEAEVRMFWAFRGSTDMFRGRRGDSIGARVAAKLDVIVLCCFIFV